MAATLNIVSFLIFTSFILVNAKKVTLPSYLTPCSRSSNFSECSRNNTKMSVSKFGRGIPEFGVPAMDPLDLGKIKIDSSGLNLILDDLKLTGLADGRANNFLASIKKKRAAIDYTGNVTLSGKYKINGRILILPVRGHGDFSVDLTNLNLVIKYNFNTFNADDGQDHWKMEITKKSYKMEKAFFYFENLFDGNKALAEPVLRFANENWETIMSDIAPPAVDEIVNACLKVVNKFFEVFSVDALSTP